WNVARMSSVDLGGRKLACVTVRGSQISGGSVVDVVGTTTVVLVVPGVVVVVGTVGDGVMVVVVVARHVPAVAVRVPLTAAGAGAGAMSQGEKLTVDGTASWTSWPIPLGLFVTLNGPQGSFHQLHVASSMPE